MSSGYRFIDEYLTDGTYRRHVYLNTAADATLCEEYIDRPSDDEWGNAPEYGASIKPCLACDSLVMSMVYHQAREDVARELDVDISEVF